MSEQNNPVPFNGQNYVLRCGAIPNCQPLPCFVSFGGDLTTTSFWKLTEADLLAAIDQGGVFVQVSGFPAPPVYVSGLVPFSPADFYEAAEYIRANQVRVVTVAEALELDEADRAEAARPLPTVDQAFDTGGTKLQAAITNLGRIFCDAVAQDEAGDPVATAESYPAEHVQALGQAALAFFTAWPELGNAAEIKHMVQFGGASNVFDREGGAALLDALSAYQNRADTEAPSIEKWNTSILPEFQKEFSGFKQSLADDQATTLERDALGPDAAQIPADLKALLLDAYQCEFERAKEVGVVVKMELGQQHTFSYAGNDWRFGSWAEVRELLTTAWSKCGKAHATLGDKLCAALPQFTLAWESLVASLDAWADDLGNTLAAELCGHYLPLDGDDDKPGSNPAPVSPEQRRALGQALAAFLCYDQTANVGTFLDWFVEAINWGDAAGPLTDGPDRSDEFSKLQDACLAYLDWTQTDDAGPYYAQPQTPQQRLAADVLNVMYATHQPELARDFAPEWAARIGAAAESLLNLLPIADRDAVNIPAQVLELLDSGVQTHLWHVDNRRAQASQDLLQLLDQFRDTYGPTSHFIQPTEADEAAEAEQLQERGDLGAKPEDAEPDKLDQARDIMQHLSDGAPEAWVRKLGETVRRFTWSWQCPRSTPFESAFTDAWADKLGAPAFALLAYFGQHVVTNVSWLTEQLKELFQTGPLGNGLQAYNKTVQDLNVDMLAAIYDWCRNNGISGSARRWESEVAAALAERPSLGAHIMKLVDADFAQAREYLTHLWAFWMPNTEPSRDAYTDEAVAPVAWALGNFLDQAQDFTLDKLAEYAGLTNPASFLAVLPGFPSLHKYTRLYLNAHATTKLGPKVAGVIGDQPSLATEPSEAGDGFDRSIDGYGPEGAPGDAKPYDDDLDPNRGDDGAEDDDDDFDPNEYRKHDDQD